MNRLLEDRVRLVRRVLSFGISFFECLSTLSRVTLMSSILFEDLEGASSCGAIFEECLICLMLEG